MISTVDLYKELKVIDDVIKAESDSYKKASLKAASLQIKLLHNIRTNMVKTMEKLGVEKVKPKDRDEDKESKTESDTDKA